MGESIDFEKCAPSVYYDYIVQGGERSAEALYYLLTKRLSPVLSHLFRLHGEGIRDEFADTIDDFFLYLHDGTGLTYERPFALIETVQEKRAFFSWLLSTYRIFLLNKQRVKFDTPLLRRSPLEVGTSDEGEGEESMTVLLATAIAYADQHLQARNRFILYRMLLTLLDYNAAIPQEAVAQALDMHPVTYRVYTKRQKDRFWETILEQKRGGELRLDGYHALMRDRMVHHFDQLYELLLKGYEQALDELPCAERVALLRERYSQGRGFLMHEPRQAYRPSATSIVHRLQEEGVGGDGLAG